MSVPHSPAELQKLYQKRFAGMREYRDLVWRVLVDEYFGMDLNPDVLQQAGPGVQILAQSCSEPWAIADDSLDVVFTSNFFEHLHTKRDLDAGPALSTARRSHHRAGPEYSLSAGQVLGLLRSLPGAY